LGVPDLDFSGTPVTLKQHLRPAPERLWNAFGTNIRSTFGAWGAVQSAAGWSGRPLIGRPDDRDGREQEQRHAARYG
jgi:hypothetical protein